MTFMRASLFLLILLCAARAHAQAETTCTLAPEQLSRATELKGLRPGMTVEEVKRAVPPIEMGITDEFGLSKTSFSPDFNPKVDKAAFQGVRTVSLDFLDGRVSSLWIGYNESFKLKTIDELVKAVTNSLKLSASAWQSKGRAQQLACGDLEFAVTMVAGSPTLRVTDRKARETWEKRRAEKEEQEP
jgi:hypothetical protein